MTKKDEVKVLVEEQDDWQITYELLQREQYDRVAEFLHTFQFADNDGHNTLISEFLAAAYQICLACIQCHTEATWHEQAYEEVSQRETELKQILSEILTSFSHYESTETDSVIRTSLPAESKLASFGFGTEDRPGLLQRLQNLLGWKTVAPPPQQETSTKSVIITVPNATDDKTNSSIGPSKWDLRLLETPLNGQPGQGDRSQPSWVIYCLGSFRVYQNGQSIEACPSRKGQAIFKYLATHQQQPVSKDILMDVFWPEADPEAARRNLHQAIYTLRQTLKITEDEFQPIQFENDCYQIDPSLDIWLDDETFEQHVRLGQRFEKNHRLDKAMAEYSLAEALYLGDFMAEDLYEEWPQTRRHYLQQTYLSIAHRLAQYYFERGDYMVAIALNQRILNIVNNGQEEIHQNLMKCYLAQDQRHLAIRQYHLCVQALKTELDLTPSAEIQALYEQIINS